MMLIRLVGSLLLALMIGNAAAAQPARPANASAEAASADQTAERSQAAPGGGEMIILAPASRYVTHGYVDQEGRGGGMCTHERGVAGRAVKR